MNLKVGKIYPLVSGEKIVAKVEIIRNRGHRIKENEKNKYGPYVGERLDNGGWMGFFENGYSELGGKSLRLLVDDYE